MFKAAADGHLPNNDTIQEIGDHFGDDLQGEELRVELLMLKDSFQTMHFTMKNVKDQLLRYQHLFPELDLQVVSTTFDNACHISDKRTILFFSQTGEVISSYHYETGETKPLTVAAY